MRLPFIEFSYRFQPLPMVVYSNPGAASFAPVFLAMAFWTAARSVYFILCLLNYLNLGSLQGLENRWDDCSPCYKWESRILEP